MLYIFIIFVICVAAWFYHHQQTLKDRAHLMREAVRNREFTFRLSPKGLFFGERAMQEALNDLGQEVNNLVAQKEVESWQRLTRVLTHEIMNVTTPIQSISQAYLGSPKIKGTAYEEGIRAIYDASTSLAAFVDSYRKLTQLQEPVLEDIDLSVFVDSIKSLYPNVEWHVEIPQGVPFLADENMLRQVLINLTKNAIEAGAKVMDVRMDCEGEKTTLLISNDGKPIPADVRRDIFVPFFTTKTSGSGIGLALSRQLMMMQNINLKLAEHALGGFHVTFVMEK